MNGPLSPAPVTVGRNGHALLVSGRLYLELAVDQQSRRHDAQAWWHHAGDGGHLAVAAARLGAAVTLFTQVGSTAHDDEMLGTLAGEGIAVDSVIRRATDASNSHIKAEFNGTRQPIVLSSPAHCMLVPDDVDAADRLLMDHHWLLADAALPVEFLDTLAERAFLYGLRTVLSLKRPMAERIPRRTWKHIDFLVAGISAIDAMVRHGHWPTTALTDPAEVVRMLPALRGVVVLRGAQELRVSDGRETRSMPVGVRDVVDVRGVCAVAAAALTVELASGQSFFDAARAAHAAARFYVAHEGTRAALPFKKELKGS